jgi:hypothetical protein
MDIIKSYSIESSGIQFDVKIVRDEYAHPFENDIDDIQGLVSDWTSRDKKPGEMLLCESRRENRFFDYAKAVALAKSENWGRPLEGETRNQRAARVALALFERLRGWYLDEWHYVGIVVECATDHAYSDSLWGLESDCTDYIKEGEADLIAGLLKLMRDVGDLQTALINERGV